MHLLLNLGVQQINIGVLRDGRQALGHHSRNRAEEVIVIVV